MNELEFIVSKTILTKTTKDTDLDKPLTTKNLRVIHDLRNWPACDAQVIRHNPVSNHTSHDHLSRDYHYVSCDLYFTSSSIEHRPEDLSTI